MATKIGKNVTAEMEGSILVLRIDTSVKGEPPVPGGRKNYLVGSTSGFVGVPGTEDIQVGLNVIRKV